MSSEPAASDDRPVRALVLADACNPEWPSLPIVGYKAARALADEADVVLATHVRNREALERAGSGRARVVYLDNEYLARPLHKLSLVLRGGSSVNWTTAQALAYPSQIAFEWEVWKHFRHELDAGAFDVVHRLTPMSPTLPSPMAGWSQVPFVLGPLNGGLPWPSGFEAELRREREYLSYLRGAYRILPWYRGTYEHAAAILAAFPHTLEDLPRAARPRAIDFPEVGIDPELFRTSGEKAPSAHATILFVGRLVPYKCPDVVVSAFARSATLRRHRLVIIGDGPERPRLEAAIRKEGLEDVVDLLGWKSQAEVGEWMRRTDLFAFPSIRELGAGVVIEAMACGCTPVVVDYGGPAGLVTEECGVKVPIRSKAGLIRSFTEALENLVDDPERRADLSQRARTRALAEFSWAAKARKTVEVYRWVLGRRADKPQPFARGLAT